MIGALSSCPPETSSFSLPLVGGQEVVGPGQSHYCVDITAASTAARVSHEKPIAESQAGSPAPQPPLGRFSDSRLQCCKAAAWVQETRQRKWPLKLNMTACQREVATTRAPIATIKLPVSAQPAWLPRAHLPEG